MAKNSRSAGPVTMGVRSHAGRCFPPRSFPAKAGPYGSTQFFSGAMHEFQTLFDPA